MIENNNSKVSIKQAIILGASMTAFEIGSGFATGSELLQFIGSWGGNWPWAVIIICFIIGVFICSVVFVSSYENKFENSNQLYYHFFGKYIGRLLDIYVHLCLVAYILTMIAGSGATLNQYYGLPTFVGTLGMGLVAALIACLGLRKLIDILGSLGIVIIVAVFSVAAYAFFTSDVSALEGSKNVLQYVEEGKVLQAGTFGVHHPVFSAFSYAGSFIMCGIPWMATIGLVVKNRKTAIAAGLTSSGLFFLGCAFVVYVMLVYMDVIAGKEIPILAAIQEMLPSVAGAYTIVIVLGIFTTVTGELFILADRFSKGNKKLHYGIIGGTALFAVVGSSFITFSVLVNVLFSFMGFLGVAVGIIMIILFLARRSKIKDNIDAQ